MSEKLPAPGQKPEESSAGRLGPDAGSRPSLGLGAPTSGPKQDDRWTDPTPSFYEQVGGHLTFVKLVDVFYDGVEQDPLLRPMYPDEDLAPARRRMLMFLEQYWGGPNTYSQERGHPRLRMRHHPFPIDTAARDAWLKHMRAGVDAVALPPLQEAMLWDYLERAAHSLINTPG